MKGVIQMKYFSIVIALLAASSLLAQNPPVKQNPVAATIRGTGYHIKTSFMEVKQHPGSWGFYVIGTILINAADAATTIKGRNDGLVEGAPGRFLTGKYPDAHKVILSASLGTIAQLASVHKMRDLVLESCRRDAADPNSKWNKIDAASHDPESCRWNVPIGASMEWAYHIAIIKGNINLMTAGPQTAEKPDLSAIHILRQKTN